MTANPMKSNVDFYSLTIDKKEIEVKSLTDMKLLFCLGSLDYGKYNVILKAVNIDGVSPSVEFQIVKVLIRKRKQIQYEIKLDKKCKKDRYCKDLFSEPLKIRIPLIKRLPPKILPPKRVPHKRSYKPDVEKYKPLIEPVYKPFKKLKKISLSK